MLIVSRLVTWCGKMLNDSVGMSVNYSKRNSISTAQRLQRLLLKGGENDI